MRLINADELMELYDNTPDCNIDDCHVSIPVIRQNILDMPTINPYEWISVEDRFPEYNINCLVFLPYGHLYTGIHVAYYSAKRNMWVDIDGTYLFDHPTHWTPLPHHPQKKENKI